jgi:hypothetical protein
MDTHMATNQTHAAFRIAKELRGGQLQQQVEAIKTQSGQLAFGEQVAQELARHFHATLNVVTDISRALLAAIHPQQPSGPHPEVTAAAQPPPPAQPPAQPAQQPAQPTVRTRAATEAAAAAARSLAAAAAAEQAAQQRSAAATAAAANSEEPTLAEVDEAMHWLRNTAPGANGLTAQLLRRGGQPAVQWVHRAIIAAWRSGRAPAAWKRALLVPIHKKGSRLASDNYRGVTLLEICGKVYILVIHRRTYQHLSNQMLDCQQGFRPNRGTGDALFSLRRLEELARDFNTPLHAAFVDFRKAFDSVDREALWQLLRARGLAPKMVDLLEDLYTGCGAQVVANGHTSDWFPMASGVRQGCPMSPTLFNVFMDFLARLVTQKCHDQGVTGFRVAYRIDGQLVSPQQEQDPHTAILMLLYADDLVLMADSAAGLAAALRILEHTAREWCMHLNYTKTQAMVFGDAEHQHSEAIQLHTGQVEHVSEFRYLGSIQESTVQHDKELSTRIQQAGFAFHQLHRRVFSDRNVSLHTKMCIYKAIVVPILIYGASESWAPTRAQLHQLDVFNNNCLRRILRERLGPDALSNEALHARTNQPDISALLSTHRLRWLGHMGRLPDTSSVKRLLFASAPAPVGQEGLLSRVRGGPSAAWNRVARADIQTLSRLTQHANAGLHTNELTWLNNCQSRDAWRDLVSKCSTVG